MSLPQYTRTQIHTHARKSSRIGRRKKRKSKSKEFIQKTCYFSEICFCGFIYYSLKQISQNGMSLKSFVHSGPELARSLKEALLYISKNEDQKLE